jgi:hypothetical protein
MKPPFEAVARLLRARVSPHHQRAGAVVGQQLEQHRVRDLAVEELNSSNWIRPPLPRTHSPNKMGYRGWSPRLAGR